MESQRTIKFYTAYAQPSFLINNLAKESDKLKELLHITFNLNTFPGHYQFCLDDQQFCFDILT